MLQKIKCWMGYHTLIEIKEQYVKNVVSGSRGTPLRRTVCECAYCKSVVYRNLDISSREHLDNDLNWEDR